ncbi:hypothetical protein [Microbacterium sp. W4I20]|uniref:hypothetical protein n=1 Tax=Microbacterium sp. W4I20 TaxID=3042262 RepID=UPI00278AD2D9|nr:hypothetical protein [Microbacterium sp. W4I20]MDQ0726788.1 hypothetical protein [Microbacterium sp. W4I20]
MNDIPDFVLDHGDRMFQDLMRRMKPEVSVTLDPFVIQPIRINARVRPEHV